MKRLPQQMATCAVCRELEVAGLAWPVSPALLSRQDPCSHWPWVDCLKRAPSVPYYSESALAEAPWPYSGPPQTF